MFDTHPFFILPAEPPGLAGAIVDAIGRHDPSRLAGVFGNLAPSSLPIFRRVAADFIAHRRATPDALLILADAMREWMREMQLCAAEAAEQNCYDSLLAGTAGLPIVIEALETAASALAHAQ